MYVVSVDLLPCLLGSATVFVVDVVAVAKSICAPLAPFLTDDTEFSKCVAGKIIHNLD